MAAVTGRYAGPLRVMLMIGSMDGGGSERQTLHLLRHLDRRCFEVHLYLKRGEGSLLSQVPADVTVHVAGDFSRRNRLYWPGRIQRQESAELADLIRRRRIDVVYDRTYHMTLIAGPACRRVGVPRISTIVSPPASALPTVERRFVELKRRRLATAYRQSFAVLAVSRQAADSAVDYYGLDPGSVEVLPNAIDVRALESDSAAECRRATDRTKDSSRRLIVCVGRMTEEKGHRFLIRAVAGLRRDWPGGCKPIRLRLIGDGPLRGELESMAEQAVRDSPHRIEFVGHLDRPAADIAAADALVLPSLFEGMPNVVLEAMALRTPVIATRTGGTTEIQRDRPILFWCEPGDAGSLADAIRNLVTSPEAAAEHVRNAGDVIDRFHDIRVAVEKIGRRMKKAACVIDA